MRSALFAIRGLALCFSPAAAVTLTGQKSTGTGIQADASLPMYMDGGVMQCADPTRKIGYATGAGDTVTQITNRSTGVTINKPCGKIQTDTTSLAAAAEATFTVTNSVVEIGDVVVVSIRSGTAATTIAFVTAVAAGSFDITISNLHASTAETGAIVINFAVIKGVTA